MTGIRHTKRDMMIEISGLLGEIMTLKFEKKCLAERCGRLEALVRGMIDPVMCDSDHQGRVFMRPEYEERARVLYARARAELPGTKTSDGIAGEGF